MSENTQPPKDSLTFDSDTDDCTWVEPALTAIKGRGAIRQVEHRYSPQYIEMVDDGWDNLTGDLCGDLATQVFEIEAKSIISKNDSPDIPFAQSINPYQGCEHGCVYCYARPSHAYLELSPALDFERKIFAKVNAATLLKKALARPNYRPQTIHIGGNTDPYQPIEKHYKITRALLAQLLECKHPVSIITKNRLILRDLDLLQPLAELGLLQVVISVTTLENDLSRILEPRATSPQHRLKTIAALTSAGIPVSVLMAPMIPFINDQEIDPVLAAVKHAGASSTGFVMLRLAYELKEIMQDWLQCHFPERAGRVMSAVYSMRGNRANDPRFGTRMTGEGAIAHLIQQRFSLAQRKYDLTHASAMLNTHLFTPPESAGQMRLF